MVRRTGVAPRDPDGDVAEGERCRGVGVEDVENRILRHPVGPTGQQISSPRSIGVASAGTGGGATAPPAKALWTSLSICASAPA